MKLPPLPTQRRRRQVIVAVSIVAIVAIWAALALASIFSGRALALTGLDRLELMREDFDIEQLDSGRLTSELAAAADDFTRAQSKLRDPWVTPIRIVPWAGTQIRSADALSSSAALVSGTLATATADVRKIKDALQADLINKAQASQQLLEVTATTRRRFGDIELGPANGLVRALVDARARFSDELTDLNATLQDAETAVAGISEFLSGPTTYLLLSANPSEMRAGSGRFLMAGPMEVRDGAIEVGELVSPGDVMLDDQEVEINDEDFAANWLGLKPTVDLRNLGSTPRFEVTAPIAADMWLAATGQQVDGVLAIDAVALQSILGEGGGVEIDGMYIDASNVVEFVVLEQYWDEDIPTRRVRQQDLASAALSAALRPDVDFVGLAKTLESAAKGRHILAWSRSVSQQEAWSVIGIDGSLASDSLMISLQNEGLNKLDTFIEPEAVAVSTAATGGTRVDVQINLHNTAYPGLPGYVLGPYQWQDIDAGTYQGILIVNLPKAAIDITVMGPGRTIASGRDGETRLEALAVVLEPQHTARYLLSFMLPAGSETITIEPSARVPAFSWDFDGNQWRDVAPRSMDLRRRDYGDPPEDTGPVLAFGSQPFVPPSAIIEPGAAEGTVNVTWRAAPGSPGLIVWERVGTADWHVLETVDPGAGMVVAELDGTTTHCYRTSFVDGATFSSESCVELGGQ